MTELRDYQQSAVENIRSAYRSGKRAPVLVIPTGGGKTVTATSMVALAAQRGRKVLWLAHRQELIGQASDTFKGAGIEHGVIMRGRSGNRLPVQVGMVGTVKNRLDKIHAPDLIVIDEAHHSIAKTYRSIIDTYPRAHLLGLTATPQRTDGTGLGDVFDEMVIGPTMPELIERGSLSPYRLFVPPQTVDVSGVKITAGEFNRGQIQAAADRSSITGDAVEHYRKVGGGLAVAFCCGVEHAEHVAEAFRGAGIPAARIDGAMKDDERREILAAYARREIKVLTSVDLIGEGFDLPAIEIAILLRPTQSLIVFLQQVGRVLRPSPGKEHAVILDHAGNSLRHGFPDNEREWTLEGRKKGARVQVGRIPVTTCGACFAAYRPVLDRCPFCGEVRAERSRTVEYQDGELVEITAEMEREGELKVASFREAVGSIRTVDDIKLVAKARGYKPGWAIRQAMSLFKMSPHGAAQALGYHPGIVAKMRIAA